MRCVHVCIAAHGVSDLHTQFYHSDGLQDGVVKEERQCKAVPSLHPELMPGACEVPCI